MANGYERERVKKYVESEKIGNDSVEEKVDYRVVSIQGLFEQFKRVAMRHRFQTLFKPGADTGFFVR